MIVSSGCLRSSRRWRDSAVRRTFRRHRRDGVLVGSNSHRDAIAAIYGWGRTTQLRELAIVLRRLDGRSAGLDGRADGAGRHFCHISETDERDAAYCP